MSDIIIGKTKAIFDFILAFTDEHGYQPSVREIAANTKIKSTSTVFYHLGKLEKAGLLKKCDSKNRAMEIIGRQSGQMKSPAESDAENDGHFVEIPIVGKIAAGYPILAVENISDTVKLPDSVFSGSSLFFLKVSGDSMVNAGILDGDLIAVNKQETADNGDIVVAMIDDEATVKRFFREKDHIRLQPENDKYEPILSRDVAVLGRVVGLIRNVI